MSNKGIGPLRRGVDPRTPLDLRTGIREDPIGLEGMLKSVARSFYLTLRVLPPVLREPMGLAYLLARAADTVADSKAMPSSQRTAALAVFTQALEDTQQHPRHFTWPGLSDGGFAGQAPAEHTLLNATDRLLERLTALAAPDASAVRDVVHTLVQGMMLDLAAFPPEDAGTLAALERPEDLDRYTYLVAGCVGEFWTDMLALHTPSLHGGDIATQRRWGMEYGKALQLTNVLRDMPRDLRIGRCYLPRTQLAAFGLAAEDLLDPRHTALARALLHQWINTALDYYGAATRYVLSIPRHCLRLRLAALWPALIGLQTLALLADADQWLDPQVKVKVPRGWVYRMLVLSVPVAVSNLAIRTGLRALERRVRRALAASPHSPD